MEKLRKIWNWKEFYEFTEKKEHKILGLMSGTSADGLDIANVKFVMDGDEIIYEIIDAISIPYSDEFQNKIIRAYRNDTSNVEYITKLNFEIAQIHTEMINSLKWDYDIVSYHGQTIYHLPQHSSTLQIGEADVLAVSLGKPVIHSFRTKDVALGGQGAPISAYFDAYFMLRNENTAVVNIGGISNVTAINGKGKLVAFDTGPGNCLIDESCQRYLNERYDKNGEISSKGEVNDELLKELLGISKNYIERTPPKTTGREIYNLNSIENFLQNEGKKNIVRTLVMYTAKTIAENLKIHLPKVNHLIIFGGGAYNKTLINDIRNLGYEVTLPSPQLIEFREAIAIAFLGELFLRGSTYKETVTGAKRNSILGKLSIPM
ncbi:MAG TPA: anhydro-N-acetylmuramic acid kinase [Fervidobacterium nodosum]|nr:anhydro-N-acetylmuramic acid kinase [Fervidobacterium nodosum]